MCACVCVRVCARVCARVCVCARAPRVPGAFCSALFTRLPRLSVFTRAHSIQNIVDVSFFLSQSVDGRLATTDNATVDVCAEPLCGRASFLVQRGAGLARRLRVWRPGSARAPAARRARRRLLSSDCNYSLPGGKWYLSRALSAVFLVSLCKSRINENYGKLVYINKRRVKFHFLNGTSL